MRRELRRLLWRADARHMRIVWAWDGDEVECYDAHNDHVRGVGSNGVEALSSLMGDA